MKNIDIHFWHKCHNEIPHGNQYFSICKTLEFRTYNEEDKEEEI